MPITVGYTLVTVTGANFVNNDALSCRLHQSTVFATYLTASTLSCYTPPMNFSGTVQLSVSNNRVDFRPTLDYTYDRALTR